MKGFCCGIVFEGFEFLIRVVLFQVAEDEYPQRCSGEDNHQRLRGLGIYGEDVHQRVWGWEMFFKIFWKNTIPCWV